MRVHPGTAVADEDPTQLRQYVVRRWPKLQDSDWLALAGDEQQVVDLLQRRGTADRQTVFNYSAAVGHAVIIGIDEA